SVRRRSLRSFPTRRSSDLGRVDGFDVLDAVKDLPTSTLILSSFARGCMADQVAARGGDYYMMKPCRIASVVERVRLLAAQHWARSEEHTSELQSRFDLVCR